jgi:hypothetical protein
MGRSSTNTSPLLNGSKPAMILSKVDFPTP